MSDFTLPKFRLPGFIASIGEKLPQWPHTLVLCTGLNAACKMRLLPEDDLKRLEGKTFLLDVLDTGSCDQCNNDHVVSPDETELAVSHMTFDNGDFTSRVYIVPMKGGEPRLVTPNSPTSGEMKPK